MARSPLTLAAAVTAALPGSTAVSVRELTEHASGRFDTALVTLGDGRRVVIQVAADDDAAQELSAQEAALRALTDGARSLLPVRAPVFLGRTSLAGRPALVVDHLPGYRIDVADLPPGRGAATTVGAALAALHALPESIVRSTGRPTPTPDAVRAGVSRLLDRVAAQPRTPVSVLARWSRAVAEDRLWRFEPTVTAGGIDVASFLFDDHDGVPTATGLLDWHTLSVGDPAVDLAWLSSAPDGADDAFAAYGAASARTPDDEIRTRARLYAELEFGRWLLHGADVGSDEIVEDAAAMLESLAEDVVGDDLAGRDVGDVDDALSVLGTVPTSLAVPGDTSMQTDTYDADGTSIFAAAEARQEDIRPAEDAGTDVKTVHSPVDGAEDVDPDATAELADVNDAWRQDEADADRAATAALKRWDIAED